MTRSVSDWHQIIQRAKRNELNDQDVADLAEEFAHSGTVESFPEFETADVASTGGPSSLSTLLSPLALVLSGFYVPKLGVPGRPAGGLDVLAQVPGYTIDLSSATLRSVLNECGYAHFIAAGRYAPLDLEIFELRQKLDAQAVPDLVIASLLSKKIAMDVKHVVLDVRVAPHGNFGQTFEECLRNAKKFNRVSKALGRSSICALTDATKPFQPFIGRGEALWALKLVFDGKANEWLRNHVSQCITLSTKFVENHSTFSIEELQRIFAANLLEQGSDYDRFAAAVSQIAASHQYFIEADREGFVKFDLGSIRAAIVSIQSTSADINRFPDPAGVILLADAGQKVCPGEPVMSVRVPDGLWAEYRLKLISCFRIAELPQCRREDEFVYDG